MGFEAGYRVSWPTLAGEAPPGIVMPNRQKWSGDHAGYDPAITAGVLVANRPIGDRTPRLVDIAPTVLKHFGVPLPASLEGTPLF